jgi:condensation domain-containing protein
MVRTSTRIPVTFSGEGSRTGELTWGQQEIWKTMLRTGRTMNIGGAMPLPAGRPIEEFTTLLRYVMGRHQSLRTRLRLADGSLPRQTVSSAGEAALDVVDIDADDDADEAAEELRSDYEFTPFDHAVEWPVRMGVIRRRSGDLTHFVVQYCHLAVDGFGIEALVRDMAQMDGLAGDSLIPVVGVQPLDITAKQQTPTGRRQSQKSLRYWESVLRAVPAQRFGASPDPREPRFWEIVCHSPAMHLAMQTIAARTGTETGHVLLAAQAVALARVTGRNPSVGQVLVSNRFRPGFAESVTQLTQPGIYAIDVADCSFDEVVAKAWNAATNAYLHGYFDTADHTAMLDGIARDRGEPVDISCFINDRRSPVPTSVTGSPPSAAEIRSVLPLTTVRWDRQLATYDGTFYLQVDATPDALDFAIWADTHHLSPADIEACAWEFEAVMVQAALDPDAVTGV